MRPRGRTRRPARSCGDCASATESLLSDLHDGAVSLDAARLKRDQLIEELRRDLRHDVGHRARGRSAENARCPRQTTCPEAASLPQRIATTKARTCAGFDMLFLGASMAEKKDPHRERIRSPRTDEHDLFRAAVAPLEARRAPPSTITSRTTHPRAVDDEHPDKPDRD